MTRTIEQARQIGEARIGRKLGDEEFDELLSYAKHKAECQGNGADYVPLLLPDVIAENEFSCQTLRLYREYRETLNELDAIFRKENEKCRLQSDRASTFGAPRSTTASALSAISTSPATSRAMC